MKIRTPRPLRSGDAVALIAPASPLANQEELPGVVKAVEELGLEPIPYPTLEYRMDYMAGSPKQRAADVSKAFTNKRVNGVLCLRGGYGAAHTIPLLDWKELGASRRLFAGFSDLTAILTPLLTKGGLSGLHAPTMGYFTKSDEATSSSRQALMRFLFEDPRGISYRDLCGDHFQPRTVVKGKARGTVIGGNLSVFTSLVGTSVFPKRGDGFILFLEDIHEKPYRIDRLVTQLIQCKFLPAVSGILLGQFTDCDPKAPDRDDALTVLERVLAPLKIPTLAGLPIGHDRPSYPIPIGAELEMNATKGEVRLV